MVTIKEKDQYYESTFEEGNRPSRLREHLKLKIGSNKAKRVDWRLFFDGMSLRSYAMQKYRDGMRSDEVVVCCLERIKKVLHTEVPRVLIDRVETSVAAMESEVMLYRKVMLK